MDLSCKCTMGSLEKEICLDLRKKDLGKPGLRLPRWQVRRG